jgi:hypothetical protein
VDNLYSGAYARAAKLAASAKNGTLKHGGQEYVLTFDRAHWHYVVTCGDELVCNWKALTLAQAKRELRHYLDN